MNNNDITVESELLNILMVKENYVKFSPIIDKNRLLPDTQTVLKDYDRYFNHYIDHDTIDFGLFYTEFSQHYHLNSLNTDQLHYYRDYVFPSIMNATPKDVESCMINLLKNRAKEDLLSHISKELNTEKLRTILDNFEDSTQNITKKIDDEVSRIDTIDFSELDKSSGIPFFLGSLQENLGSLIKGQFVVVSADYGTGKSAFVISQVASTLLHLNKTNDPRPILYFNSEGTSADIFGRVCSNLYRNEAIGGFEDIINNPNKYKEKFICQFDINKLLVFQMMFSSIEWIQNKIKYYNPALVIIDITDTLAPEEDVLTLKKVYDRLRLLSGAYCPIIGTTQSGDTSYQDKESHEIKHRKWLGDKALYGSKTGKGGAADTIITIGKDDLNKNLRYISIPKKKRGQTANITAELIDIYSLYKELAW